VILGTVSLLTVRSKSVGPSDPVPFVAVIWIVVVASAFGVPVITPPELQEAQAGRFVHPHVIGLDPVAAIVLEYAVPRVPSGSGLVVVIVGATPEPVVVKVPTIILDPSLIR
jgi:hypothetical protein